MAEGNPPVEICRKCMGPMERGWVEGDTGAALYAATIVWVPEKPGSLPGDFGGDTRLARIPLLRFSESPRFRALICPKCKVIEFGYG
jgi:hypothetical protein